MRDHDAGAKRVRPTAALSAVGALMLFAAPVQADISADDVWSSFKAQAKALGMSLSGDLSRTGDTLTVADIRLRATFPLGFGSFSATFPKLTLAEDGSGGVTISYPDEHTIAANAQIPELGFVTAQLVVSQTDYAGKATGDPGDITYAGSIGAFTVRLADFAAADQDFDVDMEISGGGYTSTSRVIEGDLLRITSTTTSQPIAIDYVADGGEAYRSDARVTYGQSDSTLSMALLPDGVNVLKLTDALLAGMAFSMTSSTDGTTTRGTDSLGSDGIEIVNYTSVGPGTSEFQMDQDGFYLTADASDYVVEMDMGPEIGGPIAFDADNVSAYYRLPLVARETPQDIGLGLTLDGLRVGPAIWAMFDPAKQLDRTPGTFALDVTSAAKWDIDTLDFPQWERRMSSANLPVEVNEITLNDLRLGALGASAQASGAMTLDYTDMETFDGFPRPIGKVEANMTGLNALLDQLTAAGIVSDSELSMARLFSGMFSRVTGDDQLSTSVEFTPDGRILANGERVR